MINLSAAEGLLGICFHLGMELVFQREINLVQLAQLIVTLIITSSSAFQDPGGQEELQAVLLFLPNFLREKAFPSPGEIRSKSHR